MGKLPDFIIMGEMKCGTTALYRYITDHPKVEPAKRKELAFFHAYYDKGIEWYKSQFPDCEQCMTGEATGYLKFPNVARKIHKVLPKIKLILILRNPVDRAYSHYHMHLRKGIISIPFEKAIQGKSTYLDKGIYVRKLKRWMEIFPREQFHIVQSEKLYKQPQKTMDEIFKFLGLPRYKLNVYDHHNAGSYSKMNSETRKKLVDYYKPYNEELYQLLGEKFNWDQ
ncbi:sulfotransferase domain-containing protein [Siminovitchia acidinfaciens]|nr:sulfotransferase domain-containing protein [Siminovitchia acidinfaciens]